MRTYNIINSLIAVALLFILTACGGGGGEETSISLPGNSLTVLSGQVADGYLNGARVFLDRNSNRTLDTGEPWTISGSQGRYSLDVQAGEGLLYPVVAEVIAGQTIDEDQAIVRVSESYLLEAPIGKWTFISPLTTLLKNELDKNPSLSMMDAENRILSLLGLGTRISLFEDYILAQSDADMVNAHRAARIIAGLMGMLQTDIETNLGSQEANNQRAAIALMISDQIMTQCNSIAQSIASADSTEAVEQIQTTILAGINTSTLNTALLDRYLERIQDANPVWDIASPMVIGQRPYIDGNASIDVVVSLTFDEEIDPATVDASTIQVTGPSGPVAGTVSYEPDLKQLNFVPDSHLMAFSSYQVDLSTVSDSYGNPLEQSYGWNFTTIFDQLPPALPDF